MDGNGRGKQSGAREIFRVDEYTTERMLGIKVTRLRAMFEGDEQLGPFLVAAARVVLEEQANG
jgi:hypothetical protein